MTIGTLIKITANKKLMMKISESAYDSIVARLIAECKKKGFPTNRLATFSLDDDDGKENHFVMISLDKYDKQNMRKFEQLLKKDVAVQYRFKPYDFIPDGETEQRCGINLELVSIRQVKTKSVETMLLQHEHQFLKVAKEMGINLVHTDSGEIIRQVKEKPSPFVQLMDEIVAARKEAAEESPLLPSPVLEQKIEAAPRLIRRRRTPVTATEEELSDVAAEVKKLEDLIAANERAISADE